MTTVKYCVACLDREAVDLLCLTHIFQHLSLLRLRDHLSKNIVEQKAITPLLGNMSDSCRKHLLDPGILLSNKRSNLVHVWRMVC